MKNIYSTADCPCGTHSSSGICIQCSKGTYQDESGQTACKQCPVGRTTKYFGSQTQLDCTGNDVSWISYEFIYILSVVFLPSSKEWQPWMSQQIH